MELTSPVLDTDDEMPLFWWGSKKGAEGARKENYKSKTEHKLLLAKQDPEPVFNLTDCNLHEVPSGIYSWCKVCRKEILLLQKNQLRSLNGGGNIADLYLLKVLDVHDNKVSKLPEATGELINLQALYLHFNQLKQLPDALKQLTALQVLNLKGNSFKEVPEVVCHLHALQKLDVSANLIRQLPNALSNLKSLNTLVLDEENYVHPPRDVCINGLEAIMMFLCKESRMEYSPVAGQTDSTFALESKLHYDTDEDSWRKVAEKTQNQQQLAHLEAEQSLQALFANLAQVSSAAQSAKRKFIDELIQEKDRMEEELNLAQNKKDVDRKRLLVDLVEVEKESEEALQLLLEMNESGRNTENILRALEQERQEFEDQFMTVQNENVHLRRKDVLEAMESILEMQYRESELNAASALDRRQRVEQARLEFVDFDRKLYEIMARKDQCQLLGEISREEEIQKKAFAALLMKRDTEYRRVTEQILLIEQELANLTLLEMRKSILKVQFEKQVLEEQRDVLTKLLLQLMDQKENRKCEFQKRLDEMETRRTLEQNDFWLLQYQRLMDIKPEQIRAQFKHLDDAIKTILRNAKADDHLHQVARKARSLDQFLRFGHKELKEVGMKDVFTREAVLQEIEAYRSGASDGELVPQPSAPPLIEERRPTLRTRFETECVICLERKCTLLFLNCGHVCCCENCGESVMVCPLCRAPIEKIVLLHLIEASAPPNEEG